MMANVVVFKVAGKCVDIRRKMISGEPECIRGTAPSKCQGSILC